MNVKEVRTILFFLEKKNPLASLCNCEVFFQSVFVVIHTCVCRLQLILFDTLMYRQLSLAPKIFRDFFLWQNVTSGGVDMDAGFFKQKKRLPLQAPKLSLQHLKANNDVAYSSEAFMNQGQHKNVARHFTIFS